MNKNTLLIVLGVIVLAGAVVWAVSSDGDAGEIDSFAECVEAGNPVMESYPRQCRSEDGRLFVEEIDEGEIDPGSEAQSVTVSGEVTEVDGSQLPVDGPLLITLETSGGESETVAVPSMGIRLCAASENIKGAFDVEAGQSVSVRGARGPEGEIVPCESADHYLQVEDGDSSATLSVGETATVSGLSITLEEVVQESRCPVDAECIEAGAITVRTTLANGEEETVNIASDDVPFTFGNYSVAISDIKPPLLSEQEIAQSDYRITFEVTG